MIGIGHDLDFKNTFECVGQYFDASDEKTFRKVLDIVVSQALDNTTAQVNLLDLEKRPSETDVAMTFYDRVSGRAMYNYVHTMNYAGVPDTLILHPLMSYRLVVHTIPPVTLDSVHLVAGRHNHIGLPAARGQLEIKQPGVRGVSDVKCIIRKEGEGQTLHVQDMNSSQKYLVGKYEVRSSRPRYRQVVEVGQVTTTTLKIPPPGKASFSSPSAGYGALFEEQGDELVWVTDLNPELSRFSYDLQPGNYRIIFRSKSAQNTLYSINKSFSVHSGENVIETEIGIKLKGFENSGNKDTRSGFGAGLLELGKTNPQVVALCADLTGSLKMDAFRDAYPDRFFQAGIAEANMMGVAAGLTIGGKIPFTGTFANFSTGRVMIASGSRSPIQGRM